MKLFKRVAAAVLALILSAAPQFTASAVYLCRDVTGANTPISASQAELAWSLKLGDSYRTAPSVPTVVGRTLIFMSGKTLYKVNTSDGKVIAKADMVEAPSYGYTPPTYADGVIYCPLGRGTVQAFNYRTMKSLWVFRDSLGGQALTPITYDDGYIYTGFWNEEDEYADYVCVSVRDENKRVTDEAKSAEWTYRSKGGFYWAGSAVVGDYLVFGTDDGTVYDNKPSKLLSVNKKTGAVVDSLALTGDQRSSVTYSGGRLYFTTKAGRLYSVALGEKGGFNKSQVKMLDLGGASTCTPVIYGDRLYIGVQGREFSSGYIKVISAGDLKPIYTANVKGYPQNRPLVCDAYLKNTGKLYVYTTYNAGPGGISVLTDSEGQTAAQVSELFTPPSGMTGYCISPITADADGTLFYKNDSGNLFAIKNSEARVSFFVRIFRAIADFFKSIFN